MNLKKIILFTAGLLLIVSGLGLFLNSPPADMHDDSFLVEKGDSLSRTAVRLKNKNLINSSRFFVYLALIEGRSNVITGKYKIYSGMSSRDIIKKLSKGDIIRRKVTIPESFNLYETAQKLEENKITEADEFLEYSFDTLFLMSIGINRDSAEGLLFPDTYTFAENQDARDIIIIMYNHLKKVLNSIDLSNLNKYSLNAYELLKLASLIEKEAKVQSERKYISAVFHNRLSKRMKLDCDPGVRYGIKKFRNRLSYSDLKYDTLYNSYLHSGLPPTPICSPGKNSILAALNPAKSAYLFFVARNDGSHYFSKTLREHNRAVDFYQKGINNGFIDRQKL
ncbi:MAG: endolytic transglycosylase MltG [Spirochaetes bacterium]|nr:endolytic transglycosylase MltG [Spirochaetota bacterium]